MGYGKIAIYGIYTKKHIRHLRGTQKLLSLPRNIMELYLVVHSAFAQ